MDHVANRWPRRAGWVGVSVLIVAAGAVRAQATAPAQTPWTRHTIDASSRGADGVRLADVNGDRRPDIVTGWEQGGVTRAYLHPGARSVRGAWPAVTVGRTPNVEDAVFVDLDADGATDVVSCCEGKTRRIFVHWAPKDKARILEAASWKTEPVGASAGSMMWMFALPIQVDGAHGVDLIAAGKGRGAKVGWFQLPADPRDLSAWRWHPLIDAAWIMSLLASDMDGDGDLDVVVSERRGKQSGCYWLERPDAPAGLTRPWARHWIGSRGREVMFLALADLDADGLVDVLAARKPRQIAFHRRLSTDGRRWESHTIHTPASAGGAKAVAAGDIDLDGKTDLVFTCEHAGGGKRGVMWLGYRDKPTDAAWSAHDISGPEGVKYDLVKLVDLDADGDLDVLTCEESANLGVFWHENPARPVSPRRR